ncbi:MAG: folate-binding protein [Hyphomicrobiales bacterium]|nr:folate-binding protein [Hyphomicrobiales bacterium]
MSPTILASRALVRVSGAEAAPFLQGLLSNDVPGASAAQWRFAALLNPQGKILFDMLILSTSDGFWLDVRADSSASLIKRLGMYRLRSKVDFVDASLTHHVVVGEGALPLGLAAPDPRHDALGWRAIMPGPAKAGDESPWHRRRISAFVPEGGVDFAFGDIFPHEANMDRLHGLDFTKGCYVGQEVVSRVEHRGLARRRFIPMNYRRDSPPPGTPLLAGDVEIGVTGSSAGGICLALVRLDRLAAAGGKAMAGMIELTALFAPDGGENHG